MHESHINDHRSSSDDLERDSTPDDRLCCAGENSSSQKSDFYLRKDVKNVPSESKQHFKSKHSKKAFQKPDNSLLNFHFERPTQTSSYQSSGNSVRNYTSSERRNKARLSMLSKETFLQANFRFIVNPTANSLDPGFYDSGSPVPWESVECVIVPHTEAEGKGNNHANGAVSRPSAQEERSATFSRPGGPCPICLGELKIPRMTKCGHLFCYTCILRYLGVTDEQYQKCPLCSERFTKSGLKPVTFSNMKLPHTAPSSEGTGGGTGNGSGTGSSVGGVEREKKNRERHRERKGSEVDGSEGSEELYTMQLLFIDKNSLFPTLPVKNSTLSVTNQPDIISPKKVKNFQIPIPGSGPSSYAMQPSITTLCECSVVPLNSDSRGKYSRIVTLSVQQCLGSMQRERAELLVYRDECLNSGFDPGYPDLKEFILQAGQGGDSSAAAAEDPGPVDSQIAATTAGSNNSNSNSNNNNSNNNSNSNRARSDSTSTSTSTSNRSRSNSCWGANVPSTPKAAPSSPGVTDMQMSRLLQQHQTQQQLHCQGDTEYLPAITEALLLLREKELCFEERCVKLGLSALLTPPPPPPLFLPSEKDKDKEKDKSKEKEKDSHSSAVERRETVLSTSSLSPTSVPFVPSSSFSPPAALRPPTDILEGGRDQPLFTSPPPSATPTTPLPSTVPSSPSSSLSPSLPRSGVTATGTGTGTGTAGASGAVTATGGSSYHMFQAPQGDLIFLHPLCTKCLLASVQNDPALLPHTVSGAVLETEKIRVNASLKQKIPFLRYLPEYCEVIFVELSMKDLVPTDILILFQEEFNKRAKKRREREKILKKEKKIENDVMLAHCLHVEEVNAMHHQSHREQSLALEQLLSGPRVGTKDKDREDGDRDGDGTEDVNGKALDDGDDSRVLKEREKEKEAEEGILKQGAAQVAVLSFARITQIGKGESFPSLGAERAKITPQSAAKSHTKTPPQEMVWGRGLTPTAQTQTVSDGAGSASKTPPGQGQGQGQGQGWSRKGTQLLSNSSSRSYK